MGRRTQEIIRVLIMALMIVGLAGCSAEQLLAFGHIFDSLTEAIPKQQPPARRPQQQASFCLVSPAGHGCDMNNPILVGAPCFCQDQYGRQTRGIAR